jgi:hypothetical protein
MLYRRQALGRDALVLVAGAMALAYASAGALPHAGGPRSALARLERVATAAGGGPRSCQLAVPTLVEAEAGLAAWQTIGGCGAGSATGIGGIKWIGRSVRGGLVNVQCQGNYTKLDDGYVYALNNQITRDLGQSFSAGVVVPYLYKYLNNPYQLGYDVSNQGLGDINLLLTGRVGAIKATSVTLSLGVPTGTWRAEDLKNQPLKQDRQLGTGKPSAGLVLDHIIDNIWGPTVIGASANYPGSANQLENYRAPSGSVYAYVGYLLGPLVPAAGLSAIGFLGQDRDLGLPSDERPLYMAAFNTSLEWSTDWMALLAGVSLPYSTRGLQPWTAGVGLSLSPF